MVPSGSDAWNHLQAVPDPLAGAEGEEADEINQLFRKALDLVRAEFQESTWQVFWLTAVEGRSPTTVAEELGMTLPAVRQAKSRVLRRLKQEMGDLLA
jgi:RNA polymerase sigma-70 factor (ECF subfamily)